VTHLDCAVYNHPAWSDSRLGYREKMTFVAEDYFRQFQCAIGRLVLSMRPDGEIIQCGIADVAVRDLIDFHRIEITDDDSLRALLSEIERLVYAKCDAGRFEEGGWLVIWPVDLLRYGYRSRRAA
jgi:hypothetical protein